LRFLSRKVVEAYASTMDRLYAHQLSEYVARLMDLSGAADEEGGEADVMAQVLDAAELKKRAKKAAKRGRGKGGGGGGGVAAAAKVSLYSISGRADVLEGLAGGGRAFPHFLRPC
jgi:hypothetical protein